MGRASESGENMIPDYDVENLSFGPGVIYIGVPGTTPTTQVGAVSNGMALAHIIEILEATAGNPSEEIESYRKTDEVHFTFVGLEWNLELLPFYIGAGIVEEDRLEYGGEIEVKEASFRFIHQFPPQVGASVGSTLIIDIWRARPDSDFGISFSGDSLHQFEQDFRAVKVDTDWSGTELSSGEEFYRFALKRFPKPLEIAELYSAEVFHNEIFIHDGFSDVILNSFKTPYGAYATGLTFDDSNLISTSMDRHKIYIHEGTTGIITESFASPADDPTGLTYDGSNLISCDDARGTEGKIFVHNGISATITDSFGATDHIYGLAFDGTNLISCDYQEDEIYVHDGISEAITNTLNAPGSYPMALTFGAGDLICDDYANGVIYRLDGVSETIKDSFEASGRQGLACKES
jgi:hypothetical protein